MASTSPACSSSLPTRTGAAACSAKGGRRRDDELSLARALLTDLALTGSVVTGDAHFCQRDLSRPVAAGGGHYFWVVKEN